MKDNFIHVCFIVDKSGSMFSSTDDVIGGFKSIVEEQRQVKDGKCAISLYTFDDNVNEVYVGKDVNEIEDFNYLPCGSTAMNDGIGTAITNIGKWLNDMSEDERPSKNLIVIMTDGYENASKEYTLPQVREMIKHQTDKYNWTFMYVGADVTTTKDAESLGIKAKSMSSKSDFKKSWEITNNAATLYRLSVDNASVMMDSYINTASAANTADYEHKLGKKLD